VEKGSVHVQHSERNGNLRSRQRDHNAFIASLYIDEFTKVLRVDSSSTQVVIEPIFDDESNSINYRSCQSGQPVWLLSGSAGWQEQRPAVRLHPERSNEDSRSGLGHTESSKRYNQ
jgi:hypothetical protein